MEERKLKEEAIRLEEEEKKTEEAKKIEEAKKNEESEEAKRRENADSRSSKPKRLPQTIFLCFPENVSIPLDSAIRSQFVSFGRFGKGPCGSGVIVDRDNHYCSVTFKQGSDAERVSWFMMLLLLLLLLLLLFSFSKSISFLHSRSLTGNKETSGNKAVR